MVNKREIAFERTQKKWPPFAAPFALSIPFAAARLRAPPPQRRPLNSRLGEDFLQNRGPKQALEWPKFNNSLFLEVQNLTPFSQGKVKKSLLYRGVVLFGQFSSFIPFLCDNFFRFFACKLNFFLKKAKKVKIFFKSSLGQSKFLVYFGGQHFWTKF